MTSVITNRQPEGFGITAEQLHGEVIRMGGRCRPVHIINGEIYENQKN